MASSKWAFVISGTGSGSSSCIASGSAARRCSRSMSRSMDSRMAYLQARWQISVMSAPLKPWVKRARVSMSTSPAMGDLRRAALKMASRLGSSGRGM